MKRALGLCIVGFLTLGLSPVKAAVIYEMFADTSVPAFGLHGTFTWTAPDFVTSNTNVPASALDSCSVTSAFAGATCGTMQFLANTAALLGADTQDAIAFGLSNGAFAYYYFANGAFSAAGSYDSQLLGEIQSGRLNVRAATTVPEPTSLTLLGLGLAACVTCLRRRRPG